MSNSIKDALKKLCLKMTGKKSNKESIQDVIDDITKDYKGITEDNIKITTETLTFTLEDDTTETLTVITNISFDN